MKHQPDFYEKGRWVQRSNVGNKYVWTISGVLWNNIKERCTIDGATQSRESTYIGTINKFKDWCSFVEWHQKQKGYGLGYQLDADILKSNVKMYSEDTCLIIPAALNKFLQSYKGKRGKWPQGIYKRANSDKLVCAIGTPENKKIILGYFKQEDVDIARKLYKEAKDMEGYRWYQRLLTDYEVDDRVIEYMKNWEFICDWKPDDSSN